MLAYFNWSSLGRLGDIFQRHARRTVGDENTDGFRIVVKLADPWPAVATASSEEEILQVEVLIFTEYNLRCVGLGLAGRTASLYSESCVSGKQRGLTACYEVNLWLYSCRSR